MKLSELAERPPLEPWTTAPGIPWDDPGFSERMLREHLSQKHDRASRRAARIDRHVAWLHEQVIPRTRGSVLDLGCGPGLYTSRLARLGHRCFGVDFSPASIEHARAEAADGDLTCTYMLGDLRSAPLGAGHGAALLLYGQLGALPRPDVSGVFEQVHRALTGGGVLVLEVYEADAIARYGEEAPHWDPSSGGLFTDRPHLILSESAWHADARATTRRWLVVDAESGEVDVYAETLEAWTEGELREALAATGFGDVARFPSLTGRKPRTPDDLYVLTAVRS